MLRGTAILWIEGGYMQGYRRKILAIYGGISVLAQLGYLLPVFYLMSNSRTQMLVFGLIGLAGWVVFFITGLILASLITGPAQDGLNRLEDDAIGDAELLAVAARNRRLPLYLSALMTGLFCLYQAGLSQVFRFYDIGILSATSVFFIAAVACLTLPTCLFGFLYYVTSTVHDRLYQACMQRGLELYEKGLGIGRKIFIIVMAVAIAIMEWTGMGGFFGATFMMLDQTQHDLLMVQAHALQGIHAAQAAPDLTDLKTAVDRLIAAGFKHSFLADAHGKIIYNPSDTPVFNKRWPDINASILAGFASGRSGAVRENIHEQVVCYTPASGGIILGGVIKYSDLFTSLHNYVLVSLLLAIIGVVVTIAIGLNVLIMLERPIAMIRDTLHDLAEGEGDLTARLAVPGDDEIGAIAMKFNTFISKLDEIIAGAKQTATEVNATSTQVAEGAQNLSQATQGQASAVEEVAAAIEEMASAIKQNALNASAGRLKVGEMVLMADETEQAARELEDGMAEISAVSRKISDIITTVNEVAFQTNLLALNAAVEAARAGEQGKGFAVVAGEVRALARRSAEAAHQIKGLIDDTVAKIAAGDARAKKSAALLLQIIGRIQDLSQRMDAIDAASSEQAGGVDEVNRALTRIDSSTQQNASIAERLSNSTDTLRSESHRLARMVERFKVSMV